MNLKKNHYSRRALALLLMLVMCVGMIPTAFAAQQNSYHDPAEHWMQASGRTNELDANSVVTRETFKCGECGKATSFEVFRVPEYTRNGQPALSRNVKYSDGTMVDGVGKGDTMDGIPGKDATYTGYHYTKAVCETCGGINTNMSKSEYGYLKNVYWLYDCAAAFTQELDESVSYEYTDDTYHTVTTKGGTYCAFCYGTNHTVSRKLERHSMVTEVLPQPANGRFATVEKCSLCDYARYDYTAAKAVVASYAAMSAVKERLWEESLPFPLLTLGRNAPHIIEQFRHTPGAVLLATGAAWEGFDFPGDCVSLLVIPRLPFAYPDARKERELEKYSSLHAFIREVAVPEMQIKLRQGFGRAIRTESDTCVIAILDERACRSRRYAQAVSEALPEMRRTGSLREVTRFLREKKPESYFEVER